MEEDALTKLITEFEKSFTNDSKEMLKETISFRRYMKKSKLSYHTFADLTDYKTLKMIYCLKKDKPYKAYDHLIWLKHNINCFPCMKNYYDDEQPINNKNKYCIDKLIKMRQHININPLHSYKLFLEVYGIFECRNNLYFDRGKSYLFICKRMKLIRSKFENNNLYNINSLINNCIINMLELRCFMDYFDDEIYKHIYL